MKKFVLLLCVVWLTGCASPSDNDNGQDGNNGDVPFGECNMDSSREQSTDPAFQLVPTGEGGGSQDGYICPVGDTDHYWFEVAADQTIVGVHLKNSVTLSAVDLCYTIYPQESGQPAVGGLCDSDGADGMTSIYGTHYIANAGTYYLWVRDQSEDEQDTRNKYQLSIETVVDPDPYEPNNDADSASTWDDSKTGFISFIDDRDWYQFNVSQAGQIMEIQLTNNNPSAVDLKYAVYMPDGTTLISSRSDSNGMDGATSLSDMVALGAPDTYYIVVSDDNDDDVDLEVGYNLSWTMQQNPDVRDQASHNDSWDTATPISSGQVINDAYLATRDDEDWYKIESPGTTADNPALLEIDLYIDSNSPVDPAIDLIVADPNTPCSPGDACETEQRLSSTCESSSGCQTSECRNARCPSHECNNLAGVCRSAGVCLSGGCGIRSLIMRGSDWSESNDIRHLHTVAPIFGSTYYLYVRDYQSDAKDISNAYSLTATVRPEPDPNEPNGLYLPYADNDQESETTSWNRDLATAMACNGDDPIVCTFSGYLSYRGDQDWFVFDIPEIDTGDLTSKDTKVDWDVQFDWSYPGSLDDVNFTVVYGRSMGWIVREDGSGSSSGIFGDDECVYLCGEYHTPQTMYLRVQHQERRHYDYTNQYNVTVTVYRDCPTACDEYCGAGVEDYACPNPKNPNPPDPP
jgi:hypothetical protein